MIGKKTLTSLLMVVIVMSVIPGAFAVFVPGWTETTKLTLYDASNPGYTMVEIGGQKYIEITDVYDMGASFTVYLNVTDVTELRMYAYGITFNNSILTLTSFTEGEFFYRVPEEYRDEAGVSTPGAKITAEKGPADDPAYLGYVASQDWVLEKPGNASGSGTLAEFEFTVASWGVTYIDIIVSTFVGEETILADVYDGDILYNTCDIIFDNTGLAPAPYGPTAEVLSIMPPVPRYEDVELTFTGRNDSTTAGYDYPTFYYIQDMDWDFMFVSDPGTHTASGQVVQFTYTDVGTYSVNLTVYDGRGWSDSIVFTVDILLKPAGALLDVTTQSWRHSPPVPTAYDGTGPFMPADAFLANKEELVELYAKVIYNDCPVVNKLVTFTVYHVTGDFPEITYTSKLSRTAFTNTSGIAKIDYRIETGWENEFHGVYGVYAYCFIAEGVVADMMTYRVEWVVETVSIDVDPFMTGPWAQGDLALFNVNVVSYSFTPLPVVVSLSLYDDVNVSIAFAATGPPVDEYWSPTRAYFGDGTYEGLVVGEAYTPPAVGSFIIGATIPRHAYTGWGKAFVNLHDAFPIPSGIYPLPSNGQPYCPEMMVLFAIGCATP